MISAVRAEDIRLSRRRLFTVAAAVGLSACAREADAPEGDAPEEADTSASSPPAGKTPGSPANEAAESETDQSEAAQQPPESQQGQGHNEPVEPYEPLPDDVYPNAKRTAGRMAQDLATFHADEDLEHVVARAAAPAHPRFDPAAAVQAAGPVHHPGASSTGEVVYAQVGGLSPSSSATRCSILVVVLQRLARPDGADVAHRRSMDVRLRLLDGEWAVERLGDAGGEPVPRPARLSPPARAVVDNPRIDLPDSAVWDIYRSGIDHRLLTTMAALAEQAPYAVTCLRSGHAVHVFGTQRRSNHADGRAVDIWQVDGVAVVSQQPATDTAAHALARRIYDAGDVPELGAPWAFDGPGGRSFENDVHRDHLHVAFDE